VESGGRLRQRWLGDLFTRREFVCGAEAGQQFVIGGNGVGVASELAARVADAKVCEGEVALTVTAVLKALSAF
jgi:hypothetical protein